jgi:diguanylate cyclase (GGDEF)-like protein
VKFLNYLRHDQIRRAFNLLVPVALLMGVQAMLLAVPVADDLRSLFSEVVELFLGSMCFCISVRESYKTPEGAYYWRWLSSSFLIWILGQALSIVLIFHPNASWDYIDKLLFSISIIPFSMLLFVDREQRTSRFDAMHVLDFSQVFIHWVAVYSYFAPGATDVSLSAGSFGWTRMATYNGMVCICLLFRAVLERSRETRMFFGGFAAFILLSGAADAYTTYPTVNIAPGHWFDLVWSALLALPIGILAISSASGIHHSRSLSFTRSIAYHVFPLLYPAASLIVLAQVARQNPALSSVLIIVCFVLLGTRMLLIQAKLLELRSKLQFDATHDGLTGVLNRGAVVELLENEVQRSQRTREAMGVMMIDLDHFKSVNDTYGHQAGDQVLKEVVKRITAELRSYDVIGRLGGEEFVVIVPNCGPSELATCAERLRRSIHLSPVCTAAGLVAITASFGVVSTAGESGVDAQQLVRKADSALYCAKAKGRNCVESNADFAGLLSTPLGIAAY